MTLSSQYKVSSKINPRDPLVLVQAQRRNNDPLVLGQGQFKVRDSLVSVQGLGLYLHLFDCLLFSNRTKLVFLLLLIFYSHNLNLKSLDYLAKFK